MTYCTQCGSSLKEGYKFCSSCGHTIESKENIAPSSEAAPAPRAVEPPAFPLPLAGAIEPLPGERTIRLWRCRYLNYGPKELSEGMAGLRSSGKGLLIATNHRLIYIQEKGALRTTRYEVLENLPFSSVRGLESRGNEVLVSLKDEDALSPRFMDVSSVEPTMLKSQHRMGAEELYADLQGLFGWWASQGAGRDRGGVLNYSVLKAKTDRAGISISSARCSKCGAEVALPTMGDIARCPRCDGAVFPQDIIKRMRITIDGEYRES